MCGPRSANIGLHSHTLFHHFIGQRKNLLHLTRGKLPLLLRPKICLLGKERHHGLVRLGIILELYYFKGPPLSKSHPKLFLQGHYQSLYLEKFSGIGKFTRNTENFHGKNYLSQQLKCAKMDGQWDMLCTSLPSAAWTTRFHQHLDSGEILCK